MGRPPRADKQTPSKRSRALRCAKMEKEEKEPFAEFVKRRGGINGALFLVRPMPQATCRQQEINRGFSAPRWQASERCGFAVTDASGG